MTGRKLMTGIAALGLCGLFNGTVLGIMYPYSKSGMLSTNDGSLMIEELVTTGNSSAGWTHATGGFKIEWDITRPTQNDPYHYQYWITNETGGALDRGLSHIILQISDTFGLDDFLDADGDITSLPSGWDLRSDETGDPTRWGPNYEGASGNPGMPADIPGISVNGGGGTTFHFEIFTFRDPMEGSFYAKDGNLPMGGGPVIAYNTGLTDPDGYFIWVPDTTTTPPGDDDDDPNDDDQDPTAIPEPMTTTLSLLGGLALLGATRRRR